jgi:hypothetical protein
MYISRGYDQLKQKYTFQIYMQTSKVNEQIFIEYFVMLEIIFKYIPL